MRQVKVLLLLLLSALAIAAPRTSLSLAVSKARWHSNPFRPSAVSPSEDTPYVPNQLVVQFAPDTSDEEKAALHERLGAEVVEEIPALGVQVLWVPDDAMSMVYAYQDDSAVNYAELDYTITILGWPDGSTSSATETQAIVQGPTGHPNDPLYTRMWNLWKIRTDEAWDVTTGDPGTTIAVIDTGVDAGHPDLQGKLVAGYDFVHKDSDPDDEQGHGTHVSGTAAAATDNSIGVAGVAWDVKVMPVKVIPADGLGNQSTVANGIVWAADHGADIVNLSLGNQYHSLTLRQAVDYAWNRGVVVVAAAGNDGISNPTYPAAYENVIGVAATTRSDSRAGFSNYGDYVSVAAPGVRILSTVRGSRYEPWSGTSMASPHAAGLAALLKSAYPDWTHSQIRRKIESSAVDLGTYGWDTFYGHGRIDAAVAVSGATPPAQPTPEPMPGLEQAIIDAINHERVAHDLLALRRDERLMKAARRHSRDMAGNQFCDHDGSDNSSPFDRIRDAGYPLVSGSEVIACGYNSVDDLVQAWLDSSDNRAVILSSDFADIGCGMVVVAQRGGYWTCNPARGRDLGLPPAPPTPTVVLLPTPTPTSTPLPPDDGEPHTAYLVPKPGEVGWLVSAERSSNHFEDDDIYVGFYDGYNYIGAFQFDLSSIPADAHINWAQLILTGQTREYMSGHGGAWVVSMLDSTIDADWINHGYRDIRHARQEHLILPILRNPDLDANRENVFSLDVEALGSLEGRLEGTRRASFRVTFASDRWDTAFSWDSGYGSESLGKPPLLIINYYAPGRHDG